VPVASERQQVGRSFWRRPQQHWFRRAIFQLHVWTGIVTGVYAVFIGPR